MNGNPITEISYPPIGSGLSLEAKYLMKMLLAYEIAHENASP